MLNLQINIRDLYLEEYLEWDVVFVIKMLFQKLIKIQSNRVFFFFIFFFYFNKKKEKN